MLNGYFYKYTSAAPLALFRIGFGIMLFVGIIRFWFNGWIEELYIKPKYYFPFYGFEFIKPLGSYTYLIFIICAVTALFVAFGLFYRVSIISLFLSFTYIELIDKTTYLNHYYFVSLICFLMIFLPAHVYFSVDAYRDKKIISDSIPQWTLDSLKLFVCFLYFFAGVAKINSDWLIHAMPLKIWLPARNDTPLIGFLFNYSWIPYLFSWFGCIYDLTIPFLLWNRKTRLYAYITVIIFHSLTSILFPIGMFPYIMMVTALIFFSDSFHLKILSRISTLLNLSWDFLYPKKTFNYKVYTGYIIRSIFIVFFVVQLIMPFRYLFYPGELFWTEEGYRFSWRVMLMEKAGYTQFKVIDRTGNYVIVNNNEFLTRFQEKMMSTQPDMILQYAHILKKYYENKGFNKPQVYVESHVALNGRLGKPLVDPTIDLANEKDSFQHKTWILLYND